MHYKGERSTFTFEHFSGLLTKAYNDLQRYGEPIIESKKVRDVLNKVSDPKLESAKQAICISPEYKNNFSMAFIFIAESVETIDRTKTRSISELRQRNQQYQACGNNNNRGRGGRMPCHGHQHNPRNHGGHGRGGTRRGRVAVMARRHKTTLDQTYPLIYRLLSGKP